jgi:hypothetical protein
VSFAFEMPLGGSARVRVATWAVRGLAVAGLITAGLALATGAGHPAPGGVLLGAITVCGAVLGVRLRGSLAVIDSADLLSVDADGVARLLPLAGPPIPLEIRRFHQALGIVWIDATADARRWHLVSGRDRLGDARWTRLCAWLMWLERGGSRSGAQLPA